MASSTVRSLRATATSATSFGLPAAMRRSRKALRAALRRAATMAPMNGAARTVARPPPMKLFPLHCPDWRVHGASPTRAAIWRRPSVPSSGGSASRVRAMVGPMPGTEARRSSFSRRAAHGVVEVLVERRQLLLQGPEQPGDALLQPPLAEAPLPLPLGDDHLDDLPAPGDQRLEPVPVARHREGLAARPQRRVQPLLGDVDPDNAGVHPLPSLRKRASHPARATARARWNDGRGARLAHGLEHPQGFRSPTRHRRPNPTTSGDHGVTRAKPGRQAGPHSMGSKSGTDQSTT
jgi:hypothetical protein